MGVSWPDDVDAVLEGDATAVLAYVTPARGAVATAVAPVGLRDREQGVVSFTTSLGLERKLDRLERDPRLALAYHSRRHGFAREPLFVLVQGRARPIDRRPNQKRLEEEVTPGAIRFMGPRKRGPIWDRWLREYYNLRIVVDVDVARIVVWPDERCAGEPVVYGAPRPEEPPAPQSLPKKGAGPRVNADRAGRRLLGTHHQVLTFVGADGYPDVVPVTIAGHGPHGIRLTAARPGLLPRGGRRAGLLGHSYEAGLVGLKARRHTGWLTVADDGAALYAPHSQQGFSAPTNKTLLLIGNGLLAKRGFKRSQRERAAA